jgi:ubiquinone/menaquinone biosynthesis C-methylase UbiE
MNQKFLPHLVRFAFDRLYTTFAWTYDAVAAAAGLGEWKRWGAAALEFLPASATCGGRVLEIAHGPGHLHARMHAAGLRCVGIDLSPQMGRLARRRIGQRAALARADALHLPFPDRSFAAIVCTFPAAFVFSHTALQEIGRTLRNGGHCIVVPYAALRGRDPLTRLVAAAHRITGQAASHAAVERHMRLACDAAGLHLDSQRVRTPRADVTAWVIEHTSGPADGRHNAAAS